MSIFFKCSSNHEDLWKQEQYRQSQQVHHRRGLRSQTVGKGLVGRDDEFLADHNGRSHSIFLTREQQDHFIPCGKVLFPSFHYLRDKLFSCFIHNIFSCDG